jgi:Outer membrane protein beta-barrel domain
MRKLVGVLALAFSGSCFAQTGDFWFNAGESFLSNRGLGTTAAFSGTKDDVTLDNGFRFSLRYDINWREHAGIEIGYAYNRTHLDVQGQDAGGMAYHQVMFNAMYYPLTTDKNRVRGFVTGGGGFDRFNPPGTSVSSGGGSSKFGANFGAGVKAHVKGRWGVRFDVREYFSGKPFDLPLASGMLWQTEVSGGIGYGY